MPERLVATSTQFWPVDEQPLAALLSQGKKYLLDTVLRVSLEAGFRYPAAQRRRRARAAEATTWRGSRLAVTLTAESKPSGMRWAIPSATSSPPSAVRKRPTTEKRSGSDPTTRRKPLITQDKQADLVTYKIWRTPAPGVRDENCPWRHLA